MSAKTTLSLGDIHEAINATYSLDGSSNSPCIPNLPCSLEHLCILLKQGVYQKHPTASNHKIYIPGSTNDNIKYIRFLIIDSSIWDAKIVESQLLESEVVTFKLDPMHLAEIGMGKQEFDDNVRFRDARSVQIMCKQHEEKVLALKRELAESNKKIACLEKELSALQE